MAVAVLGFGKSGQAAYRLLKSKGFDVKVFDERPLESSIEDGFFGKEADRFFEFDFDFVVTSPGIKPTHRFIEFALKNDMEVISELELASRFCKKPIIAITGTNGKTTTVNLIEALINESGRKALACGNCGIAFCDVVDCDVDYFVVEASSFQLEFTNRFKPFVAAILNVDFDHLHWHGSMERYLKAKLKIYENQTEEDFFIKNDADGYKYNGKAKLLRVSWTDPNSDVFIDKDKVVVNYPKRFIIDKIGLFGVGFYEDVAFASLVGVVVGVDLETIKEVVAKMNNLEHRLEYVTEIDGVKFYNDSKATNLDAVESALNSFEGEKNVVVILGGKHKGESYARLISLLKRKARAVVVYGEDRKQILSELKDFTPIPLPAINIRGAVRGAFEVAFKGDVVLFSPGGSSCKRYGNFEERGKAFKKEVLILKREYEQAPLI